VEDEQIHEGHWTNVSIYTFIQIRSEVMVVAFWRFDAAPLSSKAGGRPTSEADRSVRYIAANKGPQWSCAIFIPKIKRPNPSRNNDVRERASDR
jgi:hypothetical protein